MALLDSGIQVNTITPGYVNEHSLQVGPITDLMGSKVTCVGLANVYTRPLGYVVIWVQVEGVWGYDEDQIALVIPDFSNFATRVPIILGMPTIGCVVNVMREAEMDALATPWANARAAHLLAVHRMMPMDCGWWPGRKFDSNDDDPLMYTQKAETLEPFSSHIIPVKIGGAYLEECINVMVQALWTQDGTLPPGLTVQNTYTELRKGSKKAVVVVENNTTYLQTLWKKTPVARVAAVLPVPGPPKSEGLQEGTDKSADFHTPRLTVRQRHGKLFDELDLGGLDSWTLELADAACWLLAEYCKVFSLDPAELGCTHSTEHVIKVTDYTPFKEWFRWIPPPLVEEVRNHLKEMLESGTIRPSQSAWCNAMVLVWKKDGSLCFCIDFCHLNTGMKKDSYPLSRIQEALESLVGTGHFSCLDLKSRFWQIKMDEALKQYTAFMVGNLGFFKCDRMPFGLCNAPTTFQWLMQNCMGELNLIYCLIYLDNLIVFSQMAEEHLHQLHVVFDQRREYNLKLKPSKCSLFKEKINYLAHQVSKQDIWPSDTNLKAIAECAPPQTYTEIRAFLSLLGHYRQFIRGFARIAQPLSEHLAGEGASRKSEQVSLSEEALEAFQALKQACMNSPLLAFADYTKDFLLKTDASKEGLGAVLSQKQEDGWFHPVAYGSWALTMHEKNYHSTKLEFLALKWAVMEHFKEYIPTLLGENWQ